LLRVTFSKTLAAHHVWTLEQLAALMDANQQPKKPDPCKTGSIKRVMTRFKELSRIEAAIENKDEPELKWALSYCKMRISVAFNKRHVQAWRSREQAIEKAVQEFNEDSN
jgi:hypothetical protein